MDLRLCFLLFFTLADICAGVGLNYGDPGVCNGTAYDTVTVKVPHKCKNNKRKTCNRIEKQSHPRAVLSCCEGWIYRDTKCVPDVVTCDPPLAPLNRTHCAPVCAPDEYNDPTNPSLMCKPKCTQNCTFGNCTDIDTCSCFDGYEKISQFECKPVCETCENGSCEGPDHCVCNLGYREDLIKGKCKPICDKCEHGTCVRPNECLCNQGYTLQGDNCEPVCDEDCQHGSCTAPNQCTCEANYTLDHTNDFKCNPICEQNCVNGSCVSPNTCACNDGFEMTEKSWICRPKCEHCENGQCIGPNQCDCDTGFTLKRLYEDSWSKCYPICEVQCANGECIAPNTCKCDLGYEWNLETKVCQPICEGGCVNATCVAPNTCKCLKGYDKRNGSSVCKPVCESCFGECVAPDMCLFSINCKECEGSCKEGVCACSNGTACQELGQEAAGVASTPTLAGIQITWMMGGAVLVLLLVIIAVVIRHIYHKSTYEQKAQGVDMNTYGSVVYTVPNTLTSPGEREYQEEDYDDLENPKENELGLLKPNEYVERL